MSISKSSADKFIDALEEGKVYFLRETKSVVGVDNHYHICIKKSTGDVIYFVCTTSQYEKRKIYIDKVNFPSSTLVKIKPDDENGFTDDKNCVDCNTVHRCTFEEFENLYNLGQIKFTGAVRKFHLQQIIAGICDSPQVAEYDKEYVTAIE